MCKTIDAIEASLPIEWLWLGHRVITGDGTTVTMPDTLANQKEYPHQSDVATKQADRE
jgi:hypothetical protein